MQSNESRAERKPVGLRMRLLGAPQITLDGSPLTGLTSAKAQGLLFFLAVTGRRHRRPALAALLWGDFPEGAARASLRKALQQLRKPLRDYLTTERDVVALAKDADYWVDAVEFEAMLQDRPVAEDLVRVQRAIALYRGDFLEGFHVRNAPDFEDWWLSERARFRGLMLDGLHAMAGYHAQQGNLDDAIALTRRSIVLEPWREEAHRRLMKWLALRGQRGAALAQYETCRQILAAELGVEPAPETTALYRSIRRGELKPPPAVVASRPASVKPQRPAFLDEEDDRAVRTREPFVGREAQLTRLTGFLETMLAGQGHVAFVSGQAGWGKTRLLNEFAQHALARHTNLIVASGTCTTLRGTGAPYIPFREVLRTLGADVEQKWAAGAITREHALRLWRLLPQVVDALMTQGRHLVDAFIPGEALLRRAAAHDGVERDKLALLQVAIERDGPGSQEAGMDRGRIFEEIGNVLRALSRHQPLLLILDDLHWADASSIDLLFHLGHRLADNRIVILGAYRPEDISLGREGGRHPLVGALDEFKRLFGDVWVRLGEGNDGGRRFVDALLDSEPNRLDEEFRVQLAQSTRGHPLFTVETLRDMKEHGHMYRDEGGRWVAGTTLTWDALPQRVEGVIERRIHRLDPDLQDVLATASVEGEEFTAEVLARVQGVGARDMVGLLSSELTRRHHLVRATRVRRLDNTRISSYRFSHILFQKHLYRTLDPVERAYRHEAIGDALETLYQSHTEEVSVQLAAHFQHAGRLDKAVAYLEQAGDAAARVYASTEAIDHYGQAIDLARQIEVDAQDLTALYTRLGRTLELDSQFQRALAVYEEMESLADAYGDRTMELASLTARVTVQAVPTAVHDPVRAQALGDRALLLARDLGDGAAQAKILWNLALAYYLDNKLARAIDCGERSLALAREQHLREQMAQTLNDLGSFIYIYSGRLEQAKDALQEASVLWRELENMPMLADSLSSLATAHVFTGEFNQAIDLSEQAYQISDSIGNLWGQSYSRWKVGLACWEQGEWSKAISTMEESIRLGELAGFLPPQANTRAELAVVYSELGAVARGLDMAKLALHIAETQNPAQIGHDLGVLARLQVLNGDFTEARASIQKAKQDPYEASWPVFFCAAALAEAELALAEGEGERALAVLDALVTRLRRYGMRLHLGHALYLQGQALRAMRQDQAARDRFLEARAEAEAISSRRTLWRIQYALSEVEGDPTEAEKLRQDAREIVRYIVGHIDETNLKTSFLSLSTVRAVLRPVDSVQAGAD